MAAKQKKTTIKRSRTSAVSTVVGIALVLFMLGSLSVILMNAKKLSDYFKENISLQIYLNNDVNEVEIIQLNKNIASEPYTKSTKYITQQHAAEELENELGEDFVGFLGYNPIPATVDVKVNAKWAHPDSLQIIAMQINSNPKVKEVVYQKDLIKSITENINKISVIVLTFSVLLLIIAVALINNTIRLAIYSKRFLIKSMQLVGATSWFIQKPFIKSAFGQGLLSSMIALLMIISLMYAAVKESPDLLELQDAMIFFNLLIIVVILGVAISLISTKLAVGKYIRLKQDQLY